MTIRSIALGVVVALPVAAVVHAQEASFPSLSEPETVPGQYIVKLEPGVEATGARLGALGEGVEVIDTLPLSNLQIIRTDDGPGIETLSTRAEDIPGIAYIEPVYLVRIDQDPREPNDPSYARQWGFPKIAAPQGWRKRVDTGDVVVAVIDTGVDHTHPDLEKNMWRNPGETPNNNLDDDNNGVVDDIHGADFYDSGTDGDPMDDNGHGTHVAGTIGAVTDNGASVAGTSWDTAIMAVRFLGGPSGSGTTADAIRAIEYAINMGADIMNNSWGGGGESRALEEVIRLANDRGILFVAAAGNSNRDTDRSPHFPSSYDVPNVLSVMATGRNDERAGFSNFGANSVDVAAPGVEILSTIPGGGEDEFNGTSMATPHVAGLAALVLAENPDLSVTALKDKIMDSVDEVPGLEGLSVTGGRINLAQALDVVETEPPVDGDPCEADAPARIAYGEFLLTERKRIDENSNLISVSFELPQSMVVMAEATTSGRRISGSGNTVVRTGFYNQEAPNVMWTGSYRRMSFANADDNVPITSNFGIVMPAGEHTVYWKLWVSGAMLQLDSGAIAITAFPCSMGGALSPADAAVDELPVLEADPMTR